MSCLLLDFLVPWVLWVESVWAEFIWHAENAAFLVGNPTGPRCSYTADVLAGQVSLCVALIHMTVCSYFVYFFFVCFFLFTCFSFG